MMEGRRVWVNMGLSIGSGKLGTRVISHAARLVPFHFFCLVGILCVGLAFSAGAELVPTNLGAAVMSAVATKTPEDDQLPSATQTFANTAAAVTLPAMNPEKTNRQSSELNSKPTPGVGVEIVGGFALFLWVWRFRNSPV